MMENGGLLNSNLNNNNIRKDSDNYSFLTSDEYK